MLKKVGTRLLAPGCGSPISLFSICSCSDGPTAVYRKKQYRKSLKYRVDGRHEESAIRVSREAGNRVSGLPMSEEYVHQPPESG